MSKDKAEEKAKAYAGITPDVNNVDQLPNQFVFIKTKYFSFVAGYTQAVTDLSTENAKLREALREAFNLICDSTEYEVGINRYKDGVLKIKQLLTDKE